MIESKLVKHEYDRERLHCTINEREHPELEARLAFAFIEKWGMVAGMDDGEDSAGRQKLRLATPKEATDRAFEIAKLCLEKARENGLVHTTPSLDEMEVKGLSFDDIGLLSDE